MPRGEIITEDKGGAAAGDQPPKEVCGATAQRPRIWLRRGQVRIAWPGLKVLLDQAEAQDLLDRLGEVVQGMRKENSDDPVSAHSHPGRPAGA